MSYLCEPEPQYDSTDGRPPSRFWPSNCGCAVSAELLDLASVGAIRVKARQVREISGDVSGGIEGDALCAAVAKITDKRFRLDYGRVMTRKGVREAVDRRPVGIMINCAKTIHTKYRTNMFTGIHWLTLAAGSVEDDTVTAEDPGTTRAGWLRWPLDLVLDAAWAVRENGYWLLQAPATENVTRKVVMRGAIRENPRGDSRRLGRADVGDRLKVNTTVNGGPWRRRDGMTGNGWHVVTYRGATAYVRGELLG